MKLRNLLLTAIIPIFLYSCSASKPKINYGNNRDPNIWSVKKSLRCNINDIIYVGNRLEHKDLYTHKDNLKLIIETLSLYDPKHKDIYDKYKNIENLTPYDIDKETWNIIRQDAIKLDTHPDTILRKEELEEIKKIYSKYNKKLSIYNL